MTFLPEDCVCVLLIHTAWKMMNLSDVTLSRAGNGTGWNYRGLEELLNIRVLALQTLRPEFKSSTPTWKLWALPCTHPYPLLTQGWRLGNLWGRLLTGITSVSIERTWHLMPMYGSTHLHVCACPDTDCSYSFGTRGVFVKPWRTVLAILSQTKASTF